MSAIGTEALGIGTNTVNNLIGVGLGLAMERHNDKRQLAQQGKLQALQIKGQQQMTDYNMSKQYEMWLKTNYGAQMEQLNKAGLNPGLMYGMSGGGGTTTGAANGNVTGAEAPRGGQEIQTQMGIQMQGMQLALLNAQKQNIEADTQNKQAQATKTSGVDTTKTVTEIQSLSQGIQNQKAQAALLHIQTELQKVDLGFQKATYDDRVDYIAQEAREMTGKASQALIQANLDTDARDTRLKIIKTEYVQRLLENALITAQTNATKKSIDVMDTKMRLDEWQMKSLANDITNNIDKMSQQEREVYLKQKLAEYQTDPSNEIIEGLSRGLGSIIPIIGNKAVEGATPSPIRGFHKR